SGDFTIAAAAASQIAFKSQPQNAAPNAFMPTVVVAARDPFGNETALNAPSTISLTLSGGTDGAKLSIGSPPVNPVPPATMSGGLACFVNLNVDKGGNLYYLNASGGGLQVQSNAFHIFGSPVGLQFITPQPQINERVNTPFTVQAALVDADGIHIATAT